jgi:lysine-N-methylase
MKLYAPDYYNEFSCIADKCAHSCCIGWEIDIDDKSFEYYRSVGGEFGSRLQGGISIDDTPHFILSHDERCPFFNANNLCDIILHLGEDKLCQICADHPRYRNFFSERTEIGLGLCCEAAAALILKREKKTVLIELEGDDELLSDDEQIILAMRGRLLEIAQNRDIALSERISEILEICDISFPNKSASEWAEIYLKLEHLDSSWVDRLHNFKNAHLSPVAEFEIPFEQLLVYFLLRHTADGLFDGRFRERTAFAVLSVYMIALLFNSCENMTIDELCEIARLYSSEIEYCEENIEFLLEIFN